MLERRVLDYLDRKERGTVRPIPDTFDFIRADRPMAGRLIVPGVTPPGDPGLTFEEAGERTDIAWEPPLPSTASRQISLKSVSSVRGRMLDRARNRVLTFESILEFLMGNILMADRNIILIEDQPPPLAFEMDGQHEHTLDFRATTRSRQRVGYIVKAEEQIERDQTFRKKRALEALHVPSFADKLLICTETKITRDLGWNAVDINDARATRCQKDCDRLLEVLLGLDRPIQIWKLQDKMGDDVAVWNAVLCLYFDRAVQIEEPGRRFTDAALVMRIRRH